MLIHQLVGKSHNIYFMFLINITYYSKYTYLWIYKVFVYMFKT